MILIKLINVINFVVDELWDVDIFMSFSVGSYDENNDRRFGDRE